jgi:dienelactone hydrolase
MVGPAMPCADCAKGFLHAGTPKGKAETVHGLPTYVTEPPSGEVKAIIVVVADAFGWELPNSRILCDDFAEKIGARVYLPDFFNGRE